MKTKLNLYPNPTKLDKRIYSILKSKLKDYDNNLQSLFNDLQHGCSSGMINELIYYTDTVKWFNLYKNDINDLLEETLMSFGYNSLTELFGSKFNTNDLLVRHDNNKNLLSWFSFEETSNKIFNYNNIN